MSYKTNRRTFIKGLGAGTALFALGGTGPLIAKPKTKVKLGYLHTLAVDAQMWLGEEMGTWHDQGLDMEYIEFTTGLELFQAMVGGSLDMLATGAVISNFPARGQGQAFLINDVEWATAQLWVNPDMGVNSIQDLKGKHIATTLGTTANVFLYLALKKAGLDSKKDVQLINQKMSNAVTAFISGAVPAVALWVPFNVEVKKHLPQAKKLTDASAFYPQAAIVDGWAARNDFFKSKPDVIERIIKGWIPANDYLVSQPGTALAKLQEKYYSKVPLADLKAQYKDEKLFTSTEWAKKYRDGTVTKWLNQVTEVFHKIGAIDNPIPASKYFHPGPYLNVLGK
jgi:NitT/TauT family transport system substrate-binding protein